MSQVCAVLGADHHLHRRGKFKAVEARENLVRVNLQDKSYDIEIDRGVLSSLAGRLAERCELSHCVVITDDNVRSPHAELVVNDLQAAGCETHLLVVPPGERSKSIDQTAQLWNSVLESGAHRQTVIIAVGGGVIGDLAGFVAGSFARGLRFVQVPTTLLAQVDSSVGGKVGINLPGAKNMVGHFWQPKFVLIDTDVLATLPEREYRSGLAEVVKYGVIMDAEFFDYLEHHADAINAREPEALRHVVTRCCRLKADVVEEDELETSGRRAILNYGHTFAHAFETVLGYGTLLHGEAVAIGMLCASRLAESLGLFTAEETRRQQALLQQLELPVDVPDADRVLLLDAMRHDKKVQSGKLRFILPTKIGHVQLVGDIDSKLVTAVM
ncbi:MAG: 3-dehydroquinate synthase [Planctomycetales bacterium]|nr:3-dehydroquinate synthase [Planctomycetales bacterium]